MMGLLDGDTVLVVASSMGQKPFISPLKKGKRIGQLRSLDRLVEILGARGACARSRPCPTSSTSTRTRARRGSWWSDACAPPT